MSEKLWSWRGLNVSGEELSGVVWASHRPAVLFELQQRNITVVMLTRQRVNPALWRAQHSCSVISQLATLLQAGLTLSDSLTLLSQQHPIAQWRALLSTLANRLAQGTSLSEGLGQWPQAFPPLYLSMIRTGEITGRLEHCCIELARQQKAQLQLAAQVKKALRYPMIILSLAVLVVIAMTGFVLPEFTAIYRTFNTPLPALTLAVMATASFIERWFIPLLVVPMLPINYVERHAKKTSPLATCSSANTAGATGNGKARARADAEPNLYRAGANSTCRYRIFTGA